MEGMLVMRWPRLCPVVVVEQIAVRQRGQEALNRPRDRADHRQGNHVVLKRQRDSDAVHGCPRGGIEDLIGEDMRAIGVGRDRRGGNARSPD